MNNTDLKNFNWNVRGLNSAARRETFKLKIQQTRPHIIYLQETKLSNIDGLLVSEFLGHLDLAIDFLSAEETRGAIAVA